MKETMPLTIHQKRKRILKGKSHKLFENLCRKKYETLESSEKLLIELFFLLMIKSTVFLVCQFFLS